MIELREYVDPHGQSPFARSFTGLNAPAAARVTVALTRLEAGNTASLKAVGAGVAELRLDFGPGYRVYLGQDGETLVILLAGGTKKQQQRDIDTAKHRWLDYKRRKKEEGSL